MRDESKDETPNLLKERNFKIFEKEFKFSQAQQNQDKIVVHSVKCPLQNPSDTVQEKERLENEDHGTQPEKKKKKKKRKKKRKKRTQEKEEPNPEAEENSEDQTGQDMYDFYAEKVIFSGWNNPNLNENIKKKVKELFKPEQLQNIFQQKD